ncbi:hypothetical protein BC830DRAFT_1136292 [Chytriomyces sp. MP71]|nr:hypothetical protein BC830DRAFT_1136292 [Chytriomyces sp. MP71]
MPTESTSFPSESLSSRLVCHLDYAQWDPNNESSSNSHAFVTSLRKAMLGIGFFYLHNTPLSHQPTRARMFTLLDRFYALPLATRLRIDMAQSRHFRGYSKFADEVTKGQLDMRDQVDYATHVAPLDVDARLLREKPFLNLYGWNQFLPDDVLSGHEEIVSDWFSKAEGINRQITRALELALGVPAKRLSQYLEETPFHEDGEKDEVPRKCGPLPYARMKTIRYPAGEIVDGIARVPGSQQGVGAHKDGGWLTLLAPSEVPGLQVQDFDGNWLSVPYIPNTILVNFGQQVENVTAGLAQAATHRVVASGTAEQATRYSVAWFSLPALNARLQPLNTAVELGKEVVDEWRALQSERCGKKIVCDVPKGDLFPGAGEEFGWIAWRGLARSHPRVVERFYADLIA